MREICITEKQINPGKNSSKHSAKFPIGNRHGKTVGLSTNSLVIRIEHIGGYQGDAYKPNYLQWGSIYSLVNTFHKVNIFHKLNEENLPFQALMKTYETNMSNMLGIIYDNFPALICVHEAENVF